MSTISVVHVDILIFIDFVFIKTPVNSTLKRKMVTMMLEDLDAVNMMECLQDPCKNPKIEGGYSIHMDPPARYQISEEGSPVDVVATRNGSLHIKIGNARCEIIDALEAEVKKVVHDKFPGRRLRSCLGPDGCLKLRAPVGNTCYKTDGTGNYVTASILPGHKVVPVVTVPGIWVTPGWFGVVMNTRAVMVVDQVPLQDTVGGDDMSTHTPPLCFRRQLRPDLVAPPDSDEDDMGYGEFNTHVFHEHTKTQE